MVGGDRDRPGRVEVRGGTGNTWICSAPTARSPSVSSRKRSRRCRRLKGTRAKSLPPTMRRTRCRRRCRSVATAHGRKRSSLIQPPHQYVLEILEISRYVLEILADMRRGQKNRIQNPSVTATFGEKMSYTSFPRAWHKMSPMITLLIPADSTFWAHRVLMPRDDGALESLPCIGGLPTEVKTMLSLDRTDNSFGMERIWSDPSNLQLHCSMEWSICRYTPNTSCTALAILSTTLSVG